MQYGQQFSVGLGISTVLADFDFETYSEAGYAWNAARQKWDALPGCKTRGLPLVGVHPYVAHSSFELISMAYNLKDGIGARQWIPGRAYPEDLFEHLRSGKLVEAFNAGFEFAVWNGFCVPVLGWPELRAEQLRCCQAKARAWSLPSSLDNVASVTKTAGKDPAGDKLMRKLTGPRNPTKANPERRWTRRTAPEDFARFDAYGVQDIVAEGEASLHIPDLTPRELEIWQVSESINRRGMCIDTAGVDDCIEVAGQAYERYNGELKTITNNAVESASEVAETLRWLNGRGVFLPNLDEEIVDEQLKLAHTPEVLRVLKIRQILGFGSVRKLWRLRAMTSSDRRLRDQYAFHGAHTSLWNGQGVQMANLYRSKFNKPEDVEKAFAVVASRSLDYVEGIYGDALETLANMLRSLVVASPGHRLIMSDYTAIQAVVTAALAGETWRLDVFRTHGKIYEMCAAQLTGKTLEFYAQYRKENGKHHPDRQTFGKIPELSSGFAGWIGAWKKFGAGDFLTDDEIKRAILAWRAASPMIVELWGGQVRNKFQWDESQELYGLEGAAIKAVLDRGQTYGYRGIRYCVINDVLYCKPPGDSAPLCYHEPRLAPSTRDWARPWELSLTFMGWKSAGKGGKGPGGWQRQELYGGILTQNVVAKVSREFQADALVTLDQGGIYLPVMHTHDEIVTEVASGRGSIEEYLGIINRGKPWAVDGGGELWPIRAPGAEEGHRYGKWE